MPQCGNISGRSFLPLRFFFVILLFALPALSLPAQTRVRTLPNGLEVLVLPMESQDTVLGIVFRGGADAQSSRNAGAFKFLEQLLFRGPAISPGEPEPAGALEAISADIIEGGTGADRLSFMLSLKPELLGQGMDTLAYLFSDLRLKTAFEDPGVLEEARESGIFAVEREAADPARIFEAAMNRKLFSSAPWRLDPAGSAAVIRAVTRESVEALAGTWLTPNNAALIVAGPIEPDEVFARAEVAFAGWKKTAEPWKTPPPAFAKPGVARPTFLAYPDPRLAKGQAVIEMRYRGPDALSPRSVQAALWAQLVSQPAGRLARAIQKGTPAWAKVSVPAARYERSRAASWFSLSIQIAVDPKASLPDMVLTYKELVRGSEMYAMKTNPAYFSQAEIGEAKAAVASQNSGKVAAGSTSPDGSADVAPNPVPPADSAAGTGTVPNTGASTRAAAAAAFLAEAWIDASAALDRDWTDKVAAVTAKDLAAFADEYLMKNLEIVAVRMNPDDYAARKKGFDSYGFEQIRPETAFWWK